MLMKPAIMSLSICFLVACHPLAMFRPKAVKNSSEPTLQITVDKFGSAYIKSPNMHEVIYGLGFMHARERLFQLDMTRHASLGRLSELFGKRTLKQDRLLRMLSYKLHEQMALLAPEEMKILESYAKGVNDGARQRGRSAEHFFLGIEFEDLTPEHVVAMARLQAWVLGGDFMAELGRLRIARSGLSPEVLRTFMAAQDDRGSAIIKSFPHGADHEGSPVALPTYLKSSLPLMTQELKDSESSLFNSGEGASNAWAVAGRLSEDNKAILMNDPHLRHVWPSNFYTVTLESKDLKVSGATCVGLPSVVIGATNNIAWGVTAAYANTQDAVLLKSDIRDPLAYWVHNSRLKLMNWPQTFCLNKKGDCVDEIFYTSIYGPVIDHTFDNSLDTNDKVAIQWTTFLINEHRYVASGFFDLAKARDIKEAVRTTKNMTFPGVNLVFADTAQEIAYAYAGLVPMRDRNQPAFLPLDGSLGASLWAHMLPTQKKPELINPPEGYIITANQNIFEAHASPEHRYGQAGAPPYRALQIMRRFKELLALSPKLDFDNLALIQLESMSLEAQELSSHLGKACTKAFVNADNSRKDFAKYLSLFDGKFATNSQGALPFVMMTQELVEKKIGLQSNNPQLSFVVSDNLRKAFNHEKSALFKPEDFSLEITSACEPAYQRLRKKAGPLAWKWRWGRHHYLQRQSPLAKAFLIGGFFRDKKREVAGHSSSPMAEHGLPVTNGANLRFQVRLTTPPEIKLIIDSGNSGVAGHKNAFDQANLWHEGKMLSLPTTWEEAQKTAVQNINLSPDYSKSSSR